MSRVQVAEECALVSARERSRSLKELLIWAKGTVYLLNATLAKPEAFQMDEFGRNEIKEQARRLMDIVNHDTTRIERIVETKDTLSDFRNEAKRPAQLKQLQDWSKELGMMISEIEKPLNDAWIALLRRQAYDSEPPRDQLESQTLIADDREALYEWTHPKVTVQAAPKAGKHK